MYIYIYMRAGILVLYKKRKEIIWVRNRKNPYGSMIGTESMYKEARLVMQAVSFRSEHVGCEDRLVQ